MEEKNSSEVTAEEPADRGVCARALYDYQAGESVFGWVFLLMSWVVERSSKPTALCSITRLTLYGYLPRQVWGGRAFLYHWLY